MLWHGDSGQYIWREADERCGEYGDSGAMWGVCERRRVRAGRKGFTDIRVEMNGPSAQPRPRPSGVSRPTSACVSDAANCIGDLRLPFGDGADRLFAYHDVVFLEHDLVRQNTARIGDHFAGHRSHSTRPASCLANAVASLTAANPTRTTIEPVITVQVRLDGSTAYRRATAASCAWEYRRRWLVRELRRAPPRRSCSQAGARTIPLAGKTVSLSRRRPNGRADDELNLLLRRGVSNSAAPCLRRHVGVMSVTQGRRRGGATLARRGQERRCKWDYEGAL
jgi:hypothetical protein